MCPTKAALTSRHNVARSLASNKGANRDCRNSQVKWRPSELHRGCVDCMGLRRASGQQAKRQAASAVSQWQQEHDLDTTRLSYGVKQHRTREDGNDSLSGRHPQRRGTPNFDEGGGMQADGDYYDRRRAGQSRRGDDFGDGRQAADTARPPWGSDSRHRRPQMDPYVSGGGRHGGRVSSGRGRGRSERFQRRDQSFEDEWGRSDGFGGPSTRGGRGGGTLGGKRSGGGRRGRFAPDGRERSYDGRNDAPGVGRREDRQSRAGQDKPVREVRSWAQLRALGAPTLSAFKPKPQEVKTRKELDQEKQAQEASASDSLRHWPEGSGVTEHHRTAASSDQAETRAGSQSLLAFALGEDSLDEPDPPVADGNSELLRPPPALGARIENVYPPARRIAKEVWRPGTGKTLHEDNPEERLAEKRRREEDSRLLAQELLSLGSRDTPWKVLNELGPGLRPYEFSTVSHSLG
jgi:hypothetical protein